MVFGLGSVASGLGSTVFGLCLLRPALDTRPGHPLGLDLGGTIVVRALRHETFRTSLVTKHEFSSVGLVLVQLMLVCAYPTLLFVCFCFAPLFTNSPWCTMLRMGCHVNTKVSLGVHKNSEQHLGS